MLDFAAPMTEVDTGSDERIGIRIVDCFFSRADTLLKRLFRVRGYRTEDLARLGIFSARSIEQFAWE
jgi:hypothetical protein